MGTGQGPKIKRLWRFRAKGEGCEGRVCLDCDRRISRHSDRVISDVMARYGGPRRSIIGGGAL